MNMNKVVESPLHHYLPKAPLTAQKVPQPAPQVPNGDGMGAGSCI